MPIGALKIVSPQADEGNCTSSDGTEVSSGGAEQVTLEVRRLQARRGYRRGRSLVVLVLRGLGTRVIGHYNRGRHRVALGQLDFVKGGPQLRTTKLLNEALREVNGNHRAAITCARLVLIRNEVNNVTDV